MRNVSRKQSAVLLAIILTGIFPTAFAQTATTSSGSTAQTGAPFPDVASGYVNADAIQYLKSQGVIQGYPDGSYHPSNDMNRAEFLKIVDGSINSNPQGKNCFSDVNTQWFAPYICDAKAKGIVSGYADGSFKPGSTINFSEAAKIMTKAYNINVGAAATGDQWFKPYVTALQNKSDIPLSVGFFDENVKRDAMAEMVYRLKDNVTSKATRTYDEIVGDNFVTVNSCADLQKRFDEQNAYNVITGEGVGYGRGPIMEPMMAPTPAANTMLQTTGAPAADHSMAAPSGATSMAPATSAGAATDFSTTNVQVTGVDEGDVVKNDGKYIYIIKGNELRIVEAYPAANLKELVSFTLGDQNETFTPSEMYVDGNQLTVIGSDYKQPYPPPYPVPLDSAGSGSASTMQVTQQTTAGVMAPAAPGAMPMIYPPYYYNQTRTKVYVIDITDRTKPSVTRSVEFDGSYNTSRKVGSTLYMIMNYSYSPIYYPMIENATMGASGSGTATPPSAGATTSTSGSATADTSSSSPIVPEMMDTKTGVNEPVAPCSQIRILPKENNFNYLITAAVPLSDLTKDVSRSVIVGTSDNIYASSDNLYVAGNNWGGGFYRPYGDYDTSVYRFALGNGTIEYKNYGTVPGQILNQFSMDESNGYFRIATTKNEYVPGSEINNNVYVLDMNMNVTGKIENIAPGEKIYSVRFMGDRAYMVTFLRVDPFFVLDLSNPSSPKIAGQLKLPGYSDYLQAYDSTHILGFGHDVDPTKVLPQDSSEPGFLTYDAMKGFKVSLFDVTDLSNPKEMFTQIIGDQGTTSPVLTDHKALLFDHDKGLLAFPITVYQFPQATDVCSSKTYSTCPTSCQQVCVPSSCTTSNGIKVCSADCDGANSCVNAQQPYAQPVFDGAYVYNIDLTKGFTLKGKITHYSTDDQTALTTNGYTNYDKTIQRLMYIGEDLYSVSQAVVKANLLSDVSDVNMIQLAASPQPVYYAQPL